MTVTTSRLRSRLSREILRILAFQVAGPIATAELFDLIRLTVHASRSLACFLPVVNGPRSWLYTYLYRLSDRGLLRLDGCRRKKLVLLTRKGRRLLERLRRNQEKKAYQPARFHEEELTQMVEPLPNEVSNQKALIQKRLKWTKLSRRKEGAVFLSYDIPEAWDHRRDWFRQRLKELGFERFHRSFYVCTTANLRRIVEEAEGRGLMPYLCWGKLEVMPG